MKTVYKTKNNQIMVAETFVRYTLVLQDLSVSNSLTSKELTQPQFEKMLKETGAIEMGNV